MLKKFLLLTTLFASYSFADEAPQITPAKEEKIIATDENIMEKLDQDALCCGCRKKKPKK